MTERTSPKGLWAYFILVYTIMLLTWGVMALFQMPGAAAGSNAPAPSAGALFLYFLGGFSPSIAGLVMTWRVGGSAGLRDLWQRTTRFHLSWRWYASIIGLPFLVLLVRIGVQVARGGNLQRSQLLTQPLGLVGFSLLILIGGALAEEFGWRGFALERMLNKWNLLKVNLILGVLWAFWHLPVFFIPGTVQQMHGNPLVEFPIFAVSILALTVLITWVYTGTARSLFAAILFHLAYDWFFTLGGTLIDGGTIDRLANALALVGLAILVSRLSFAQSPSPFAQKASSSSN